MIRSFLAQTWFQTFLRTVQEHEASTRLRDAAIQGKLRDWTQSLTSVVVSSCETMGWQGAAKGHRSSFLPVPREEYLGLDVVAFEPSGDKCWRFPIAVFELENSKKDDLVTYSLWKVLCVRSHLRVVFCYRRDVDESSSLVRELSDRIVGAMTLQERGNLSGETLLVLGGKNEAQTFPYGFFKEWLLDTNTGRFSRP